MSKNIFAGTVVNCGPNMDKDKNLKPGGNILIDFKVMDNETLKAPFLASIRYNDQASYDHMLSVGLGKGATFQVNAAGVHEWDESKGDRTLRATPTLPARPICRFMGLDLDTGYVAAGVRARDLSTTTDEDAVRGAKGIVAALAGGALAAIRKVTQATGGTGTVEEVQLNLDQPAVK